MWHATHKCCNLLWHFWQIMIERPALDYFLLSILWFSSLWRDSTCTLCPSSPSHVHVCQFLILRRWAFDSRAWFSVDPSPCRRMCPVFIFICSYQFYSSPNGHLLGFLSESSAGYRIKPTYYLQCLEFFGWQFVYFPLIKPIQEHRFNIVCRYP